MDRDTQHTHACGLQRAETAKQVQFLPDPLSKTLQQQHQQTPTNKERKENKMSLLLEPNQENRFYRTSEGEMFRSEEIGALTEALVHFHTQCPVIPKDRRGTYGKYADLSTILEKVQPILSSCNLAVIQMPVGEFGLITILAHTSGEYIGCKYEMKPEERIVNKETKERAITPQSIGAVITYQRRYALGAILSLNIDDDTDAEGTKEPEPPKKSAKELMAEKAAAKNSTPAEVKTESETTTKLITDTDGPTKQSDNDPCGDEWSKKIKDALVQLEQHQKGSSTDFTKRLKASGRQKIAELTISEAKQVLKAIEEKNIVAFFEKSLQPRK